MMIRLKDLRVGYTGRELLEVANIELSRGKLHVLIGKNGVGKSSLLRTMAGLQEPQSGHVFIGDTDIADLTAQQRGELLHYLPGRQEIRSRIRLSEFLEIGAARKFRRSQGGVVFEHRLEEVLSELGIHMLKDSYVQQLSDGEFQKMMIALVMLREAKVVLLDEPLSHLDPPAQAEILHLFKTMAKERVLLMSSHQITAMRSEDVAVFILDADKRLMKLNNLDRHTEKEIVALYQ